MWRDPARLGLTTFVVPLPSTRLMTSLATADIMIRLSSSA
jgi:hypothetical protein